MPPGPPALKGGGAGQQQAPFLLEPEHAFGCADFFDNCIVQAPRGLVNQITGAKDEKARKGSSSSSSKGGDGGSNSLSVPGPGGDNTSIIYVAGTQLVMYNYETRESIFIPRRGPPAGGAGPAETAAASLAAAAGSDFRITSLAYYAQQGQYFIAVGEKSLQDMSSSASTIVGGSADGDDGGAGGDAGSNYLLEIIVQNRSVYEISY